MEVKSFLIEEHAGTIFDNEEIERWKNLVEELGLENQKALISENKSMMPFPTMTEAEKEIYGAIFQTQTDYKKYDGDAIPLQILSLISLAEREKYFDRIQIWCNPELKDPIVVGQKYANDNDRIRDYTWNMSNFLIGMWGEKLKSLAELFPLWESYTRKKMIEENDYHLSQFNKKAEKFKFQINATSVKQIK